MLIQICATFGLAVTIRALAQFFFTPDFRTIKIMEIAYKLNKHPITKSAHFIDITFLAKI